MLFLGSRVTLQIGRRARIHFGRWVWIGHGTKIRCHEGEVSIGDKTVMGQECTISAYQHVSIGEQCILADRVMLIDFDHNVAEVERPIRVQGIYKRDVRVGNNVWIGHGAQILRGATRRRQRDRGRERGRHQGRSRERGRGRSAGARHPHARDAGRPAMAGSRRALERPYGRRHHLRAVARRASGDAQETTVYLVRHPLATTRCASSGFPSRARLDHWCAAHDQPEAVVGGLLPARPLPAARRGSHRRRRSSSTSR